jgi:DNA helicase-2/ATP-dependent DNA helicase PcrA
VNAANSVIERNSARIPKECYSRGEVGDKIRLIVAYDEKDEVKSVASAIKSIIYSDHAEYQDFAILYRTLNQSRVFEQYLREGNIPCVVYSSPSFLERKEVKDVLSFFKLFANKNDDESFKRAISLVQGIGSTTIEQIESVAKQNNMTMSALLETQNLEILGFKSAAISRLLAFRSDMQRYTNMAASGDCYEFAREVVLKYNLLSKYKNQSSIEDLARAANVEELLDWVKSEAEEMQYEKLEDLYVSGEIQEGVELRPEDLPPITIGEFLEKASLLSATDSDDDDNKVKLMTVHASKGLEFKYVFLVGMEENIFPSGGWLASDVEIEEERRLFYVAMTRAKERLQVSFAKSRLRNGKTECNSPSRFVREIDRQYIQNPGALMADSAEETTSSSRGGWGQTYTSKVNTYGRSSKPVVEKRPAAAPARPTVQPSASPRPVSRPQTIPKRTPDADFEPTPIMQLRAGQRIEHNRFGYGQILEISGNVTDLKAKILFDEHGEKILILKYAKIRAV